MDKNQGATFGDIAPTAVVRVDSGYGPKINAPGIGTIVDVVQDGAGLFPNLSYDGPATLGAGEAHEVRARLVTELDRWPLGARPVTFALDGNVTTVPTASIGVAGTAITVPAETLPGATTLTIQFSGDADASPIQLDVPVTIVSLGSSASSFRAGAGGREGRGTSQAPST